MQLEYRDAHEQVSLLSTPEWNNHIAWRKLLNNSYQNNMLFTVTCQVVYTTRQGFPILTKVPSQAGQAPPPREKSGAERARRARRHFFLSHFFGAGGQNRQ